MLAAPEHPAARVHVHYPEAHLLLRIHTQETCRQSSHVFRHLLTFCSTMSVKRATSSSVGGPSTTDTGSSYEAMSCPTTRIRPSSISHATASIYSMRSPPRYLNLRRRTRKRPPSLLRLTNERFSSKRTALPVRRSG